MVTVQTNIHPEFHRQLGRSDKEALLKQHGLVLWLYGLSGSGKSTLANALDRNLHEQGILSYILDGDNLRSGLNKNLGFSQVDREENIRRSAETAKILLNAGIVVIASFITPKRSLRSMAREIIGEKDFFEVYLDCSLERCAERDVKGLYQKAKAGEISQFTGLGSEFEPPETPNLILDTNNTSETECQLALYKAIIDRIQVGS